jgi:copper chaperone CopZ
VRVSLKAVPGVDNVDVSLEKGLARVTMKPGNSTTLKQLRDAIAKNGFTMKGAQTTVIGKIMSGGQELQVSGSNDVLKLLPAQQGKAVAVSSGTVKATGEISEAPKGKLPDTLKYESLTEVSQ